MILRRAVDGYPVRMPHRSRYASDPYIGPILPKFHARLAQHVKHMEAFRAAGNGEELRRLLHQLKGSGKSYGYDGISTHAAAAEESLRSGGNGREALDALIAYIRDIEGIPHD
jgi:HPt (histidine-containing phosphotransfer) domain-containing protein